MQAMIKRGLVPPDELVERFLSAADVWTYGAKAHKIPRIVENLNWVQREYLGVPETQYELPPWADY